MRGKFQKIILIILLVSMVNIQVAQAQSELINLPCDLVGSIAGPVINAIKDVVGNLFDSIGNKVEDTAKSIFSVDILTAVPVVDQAVLAQMEEEAKEDKQQTLCGQIIKKVLLDRLVDRLIAWIQGGFKGKIVSDWKQFLQQAGNDAVGELLNEVTGIDLCKPFKLQLQIALAPVPTFSQEIRCSLDKIITNLDNFYTDFRNGGWLAYSTSWQPQNNFFGATLIGLDESFKRKAEAETAAQSEGIAGRGYLSARNASGRIIRPGSLIGDTVSQVLVQTPLNTILSASDINGYVSAIANAFINRLTQDAIEKILGK